MLPRPNAVLALLLLAACGPGSPASSAPSFQPAPLMTLSSSSGGLQVVLRSSPQPPSRGLDDFELAVTDASGAPASGLHLDVQPWMPAMGHGASVTPTVTENSPGVYEVTQVYFAMPGTWELRTAVADPAKDTFAPAFQIP